jgi:PAS domain S-box-containing protein
MELPRFSVAYGYPAEETPVTGSAFLRYVHPDDLPAIGAQLEAARRGERDDLEFEHRVRAASGEWLWMLGRARVIARGSDGTPLRMLGSCVDTTERRLMLERLQLADRLAAVGTLAAGVAHEINNPLAYVNSNVSFALDRLDEVSRTAVAVAEPLAGAVDEARRALRDAAVGGARVERIVRDLRMLSRSREDPARPVDVARALETALDLARTDLRQRARVLRDVAAVPPVLGDESRVSQVFVNLLVNAAQAIPDGKPDDNEVEVRLGVEDGRVVLRVRDTGCGIPPENLKRIFDPFFTTKPVGVGTGLGLAISHRIVTALGGDITVESAPGSGSTFRVSLPAASDVAAPPPAGSSPVQVRA